MENKERLQKIVRATESIAMECDFLHMKREGSEHIIKTQLDTLGELLEGESYETPVKMLSIIMRRKSLESNTPLIQDVIEGVCYHARQQLEIENYD